jgi:hypothetical protein
MGGDAGKTSTGRVDQQANQGIRLDQEHGKKVCWFEQPPKYCVGRAKPSLLDPFKPYIDAVLAEYDLSARRIS